MGLGEDFPFSGGSHPISACLLIPIARLLTALPGLCLDPSRMSSATGVYSSSVCLHLYEDQELLKVLLESRDY